MLDRKSHHLKMEGSDEILLDLNKEEDFKLRMKDLNRVSQEQLEDMKQLQLVEVISDHFMMKPNEPLTIPHEDNMPYGAVGEFFKGQTLQVSHKNGEMILWKEFEKK